MVIPARVNPADSSGPMSVGGPNTRTVTLRAALLGIESPHPGRHLPAQLWDPPAPHVAEQAFDGRGATARAGPDRAGGAERCTRPGAAQQSPKPRRIERPGGGVVVSPTAAGVDPDSRSTATRIAVAAEGDLPIGRA